MTIVNEIDEKNPENNRTIDTETGVYLKPDKSDLRDSIYCFMLKDGDTSISISTSLKGNLDEINKRYDLFYKIEQLSFFGYPKRVGYIDLIKNLLTIYGDLFRYGERRFGNVQYVNIEFTPEAIKKIINWEDDNV